MRFINLMILLFLTSLLLVGNAMYQSDIEEGKMRDINNLTSDIKWDYNYTTEDVSNDSIIMSRTLNIVNKGIDFIGFTSFEVAKSGVEFGYSNPQYDYQFAFDIVKLILILSIIAALVPLLIPMIALLTILCMSIYRLIKKIRNKKLDLKQGEDVE